MLQASFSFTCQSFVAYSGVTNRSIQSLEIGARRPKSGRLRLSFLSYRARDLREISIPFSPVWRTTGRLPNMTRNVPCKIRHSQKRHQPTEGRDGLVGTWGDPHSGLDLFLPLSTILIEGVARTWRLEHNAYSSPLRSVRSALGP